MNMFNQIQNYCEDHFDVVLTKNQIILVVMVLVLSIVCIIYVTTAEKVVIDKANMQSTPPRVNAPLFEKK